MPKPREDQVRSYLDEEQDPIIRLKNVTFLGDAHRATVEFEIRYDGNYTTLSETVEHSIHDQTVAQAIQDAARSLQHRLATMSSLLDQKYCTEP